MASGAKMSYNHYQNGKYNSFAQPAQKDVEVTHDMHLKMSKKIAQLTKVIYALNTKNDENESILQSLRDQHEEEIQQILSDTKQKVAIYKGRLDEESDHIKTIEALQSRIAEYQVQNSSLQDEFSTYKAQTKRHQDKEKGDYVSRLADMNGELLRAKHNFEERMNSFASWKERILSEHATALAELESKHQKELEDLRSFQRDQDDTWLNQSAQLEEKFRKEIDDLKSQIETLNGERETIKEEYTHKLDKATAFYEKELDALRQNTSQKHEGEVESLRKEIDRLKADFGSNEKELRSQIDRLVRQLADTEDSLEEAKKEILVLQADLSGRDSSSSELSKQVHDLTEEVAKKTARLKDAETELQGSKHRCENLADQLTKKSTALGEAEAHNIQKDGTIASLHEDLKALRNELSKYEAEKASLLSKSQSMSSEQQAQLDYYRKALEDMTIEKESLKQRSERQIQSLQEEMKKKEQELGEEMVKKLEEAERKHAEIREKDKQVAADLLCTTKKELTEQHTVEINKIIAEKEKALQALEDLKAELTAKLESAEKEVSRLQKLVRDNEEGLGSAAGQLTSMKDAMAKLQAEVDRTSTELRTAKTKSSTLQAELDKLKLLHDGKLSEMEETHRNKLQTVSKELDAKWAETMRVECGKLRQELTSQMEDEKRAALSQLSRLKDEEMAAVRKGLDAQILHLKTQLDDLQRQLDSSKVANDADKQRWQDELDKEKSKLQADMLQAANEYSAKVAAMDKMHEDDMERLQAKLEQERIRLEAELKEKHMEELQGQLTAHKAALENANQLNKRETQDALEQLKAQHKEELEKLREELESRKESELERLRQSHSSEVRAARMELDRAVEISKQKERDHQMQVEELRTEIAHREQHIKNLQDQIMKLNEEIDKLRRDIEAKNMVIKQVQKQASQQLRVQEDKLTREHQANMDNLTADQMREKQEMLAQFASAQEMLKDRISGLQIELQEAQMRYEQRDSRPEDLELIESLRIEVSEREVRIKDLIDEKRFYQLELVNRETNFNKVFNTAPNVGVLNPFQKPKKKGERPGKPQGCTGPQLGNGLNGSHTRLDPLPGSPMHDGKLNPSKPLPQPNFTKKFVK